MPSWLARVLAALVAVGLIAGAVVIRGMISGDDGVAAGSGDGGRRGSSGGIRALCDDDLGEEVCAALAGADGFDTVEVVTAGEVLDAAVATPGDAALDVTSFDAWLTLDPLPQILEAARTYASLPSLGVGEPEPVASSPLVLLVAQGSLLGCADADTAGWDCLTATVDPPVVVPDVSTSIGTVVVGAAGAALAGTTDVGIEAFRGSDDSDAGPALRALVEESSAGTTAADQAAALYLPGNASGVLTVDAVAASAAATAQGRSRGLTAVPVEPDVTVGVVLVGLGQRGDDAVADLAATADDDDGVAGALADAGWVLDPAPSDGLLDPDVVYALREEVR